MGGVCFPLFSIHLHEFDVLYVHFHRIFWNCNFVYAQMWLNMLLLCCLVVFVSAGLINELPQGSVVPVVAPLLEELGLEAEHDLVVVAGPHGGISHVKVQAPAQQFSFEQLLAVSHEDCFICLNVFLLLFVLFMIPNDSLCFLMIPIVFNDLYMFPNDSY